MLKIFGEDNWSSPHTDNRKLDILILGQGTTQELNNPTTKAEAKYFINITASRKKFF